jgi:RHS repeat-associated protein
VAHTLAFKYFYDANGGTLSDPSGKSYTWDFENRLVSATVPGTGAVNFKYDPFGGRIYKSSPNFTGIFVYDAANLIETLNSSGTEISSYTLTRHIDEPLAEIRSGGSSYYEADGLGSITSLSSSTGTDANTDTYDSFGKVTNFTGTLSNPFRYTAREFDAESNLDYYRARYYDPTSGRFLSEDLLRFGIGPTIRAHRSYTGPELHRLMTPDALRGRSADFYSYVSNSPIDRTDPKRDANSIPRLAAITIDPDTTTKSPGDSFLKTLFILRQD